MVALIIAIIAIGLIVAVVASTMYHGASTDKGVSEAKAAELMAQGQQIVGATTFYRAETGKSPTSLEELTPTYLKSIPKGWAAVDGYVVSTAESKISDEACKAYNVKQQVVGIPECSDASYADKQLCCHVDGE